jgi:hypothetical protein
MKSSTAFGNPRGMQYRDYLFPSLNPKSFILPHILWLCLLLRYAMVLCKLRATVCACTRTECFVFVKKITEPIHASCVLKAVPGYERVKGTIYFTQTPTAGKSSGTTWLVITYIGFLCRQDSCWGKGVWINAWEARYCHLRVRWHYFGTPAHWILNSY